MVDGIGMEGWLMVLECDGREVNGIGTEVWLMVDG